MHIDCTEDLSTASFMLCFERFINRFIGAARTLGTPTQLPYDLQDFTAKAADLQAHCISWHFIPARSHHKGIRHPSYEGGTQKESASLYSHCCRISSPSHHCRSCPEQQASATHLSGRSRRCSSCHSWTLLDWETHQGTPSRHPTTQRWTQESQMEPAQS